MGACSCKALRNPVGANPRVRPFYPLATIGWATLDNLPQVLYTAREVIR